MYYKARWKELLWLYRLTVIVEIAVVVTIMTSAVQCARVQSWIWFGVEIGLIITNCVLVILNIQKMRKIGRRLKLCEVFENGLASEMPVTGEDAGNVSE